MKTAIFILAAVAGLVSAQTFGDEPKCAIPCLTAAIQASGCQLTDQACQCGSGKTAITSAVTPCLLSSCNATEVAAAASIGNALCVSFLATAGSSTATSSAPVVTSASAASNGTAATTLASGTAKGNTTTVLSTSGTPKATSSPTSSSSAGAAPTLIASFGGLVGLVAGMVAAL